MTLSNLLIELDKLNRSEKLRVIQHLAHDLETEVAAEAQQSGLTPGGHYEVWSPQDGGKAVATLHKLLQDHQQTKDAE
ncbi:MAG: hypothetical protein ABI947_19725 [Chloroflexota bacterium]